MELVICAVVLAGCGPANTRTNAPPVSTRMAGDEVGNGGGLGEKNVEFAYLQLPKYLTLWSRADKGKFTVFEQHLLEKVNKSLIEVPPDTEKLVFLSEKQNPGTFFPDGLAHGTVRTAVTGNKPDSLILVNRDHLYAKVGDGVILPIDVPSAAAPLLDELAHHVEPSFKDPEQHRKLDALCAKLKVFLMGLSDKPAPDATSEIQTKAVNFEGSNGPDAQLLVYDSFHVFDISDQVRNHARCMYSDTKVQGIRITNLHWHVSGGPYTRADGPKILHGRLYTICDPSPNTASRVSIFPYERVHKSNLLVEVPMLRWDEDSENLNNWGSYEEFLPPNTQPKQWKMKVIDSPISSSEQYLLSDECH
jgi:hypothetical protein